MKKIFFTLLIIVCICQSFAQIKKQKATVIFKDGKELSCFARISGKNVRYIENDTRGTEKVVDEKDIIGLRIYMNDKLIELHYKREEGKTKFRLMELVVSGKMKLYRLQDVYNEDIGMTANDSYLAQKTGTSEFFVLSKTNPAEVVRFKRNFEDEARIYFSDCKVLVDKIGEDRFRRKDIMKIAVFYNENCGK